MPVVLGAAVQFWVQAGILDALRGATAAHRLVVGEGRGGRGAKVH